MTQSNSSMGPSVEQILMQVLRAAPSTTGARLTPAQAVELWMSLRRAVSGASLIAETKETPMQQQMKPWWRSRGFAGLSVSLRLWLCFLAAACIVIGLWSMLYVATSGSCGLGL